MRILVTGAAGFIGSVVSESLILGGHEVFGIDNFDNSKRGGLYPGVSFEEGSILDRDWLIGYVARIGVDAVYHFAAEAFIAFATKDPGRAFAKNVTGSINLMEAMRAAGVRDVIFSSTAAVYGAPRNTPIREDDPLDPINAYGESKLAFERMLPWYAEAHGIRYVILRYFNACGATESRGEDRIYESHLIPIAADVALGRRDALSIFGNDYPTPDGTCVRDYVHVSDIADAHIRAMERIDSAQGRAFSLGSGDGYTVRQVVESVERISGRRVNAVDAPRRPGDPPALVASYDRAREVLGWSPDASSLDNMVRSAYQWRAAHPSGYGA